MTRTTVGFAIGHRGKAANVQGAGRYSAAVEQLLDALESDTARVKLGASKSLRELSESSPAVVYPYFEYIFELLGHENNIIKWNAAFVVANLAKVDARRKLESVIDQFLAPICGPSMITAANTIAAAVVVARAKPRLAARISGYFLQTEWSEYQTAECRNIAIGHAIQALARIFDLIKRKQPVIVFARRQLENRRNATRKKAAAFLRKYAAVQEG